MEKNIKFEEMRSPQIRKLADDKGMVILPIGACEEHGRHLPVITDTTIAYRTAIDAARIASDRIPLAVLPPVWFGYTVGVLKQWSGTITIRPKLIIDLIYDICKSLIEMKLGKILIINGHGNNPGVLDVAARSIGDDFGVSVGLVNAFGLWDKEFIAKNRKSQEGGIGHACEIETSLMLYYNKELVDMSVADNTDIMKSKLKYCPVDFNANRKKVLYLSTWFLEDSTYGGAGDPTDASADFGKKIHDQSVKLFADVIDEFYRAQQELEKKSQK